MEIRKASRKDAGNLAALFNHVEDSGYMLFNPGERKATANKWKSKWSKSKKIPFPFSSLLLAAMS